MKKIILMLIAILFIGSDIYALCIGGKHLPKTEGSPAQCLSAYNSSRTNNAGKQSANTGTIVNLNQGPSLSEQAAKSAEAHKGNPVANHYFTIELSPFHFPSMASQGRQSTSEIFLPTAVRWDWWLSKNMGFGVLYEQYTLSSSINFKPITETRTVEETIETSDGSEVTREVEKDIPIAWPGEVREVDYQRLMYFVAFNAAFGDDNVWNACIRIMGGIGYASIKYNDVDIDDEYSQWASQPDDKEVSAGNIWVFDFAVERWYEGTRLAAFIRFTEANNEDEDYLEYVDIGGTSIGLSASFAIPYFGYLN